MSPCACDPGGGPTKTGTTFLSLRHGGRVIEIAPGMTAIEVGAFADLPGKLTILRDAALEPANSTGAGIRPCRGRAVPGSGAPDGECVGPAPEGA